MDERRRHQRIDASIEVILNAPDYEHIKLRTGNLSRGGLFLLANGVSLPDVGAIVGLRMGDVLDHEATVVLEARVARSADDGIGIEYI